MIRDPEVKILTVNEFMRMSGLQRSGYIRLMSVKLDEYTKSDVTLPAEPEKPKCIYQTVIFVDKLRYPG